MGHPHFCFKQKLLINAGFSLNLFALLLYVVKLVIGFVFTLIGALGGNKLLNHRKNIQEGKHEGIKTGL